jgi:diguanylate cyclase (GGDEF)-like protein
MRPLRFALGCAAAGFAGALPGLIGWLPAMRGYSSWLPNRPPETPLGGCALAAAALALAICTRQGQDGAVMRWGGRILGAAIAVVGAVVLAEHLLGLQIALDIAATGPRGLHPGAAEPGARSSPQMALSLILYGIAVWFTYARRGDRFDLADVAAGASLFTPMAALIGCLFEFDGQADIFAGDFGMSPLAAVTMVVLAVGLQSLNPRRGFASLFAMRRRASPTSRKMILAAVLFPILIGYIQVRAIHAGLLDLSLGVAFTVAGTIFVFVVLIIWNAELVMRLYHEQHHQLAAREERARREAITDALTQLINRRGWEDALVDEDQRCERENADACVIAIDLDELKLVNDREGHAKGDEMLKRAALALSNTARRNDVVARLGGDEFGFLATGIAAQSAPIVLERLRSALQAVNVSASMGYGARSDYGNLASASLAADGAMYVDKRKRKAAKAELAQAAAS